MAFSERSDGDLRNDPSARSALAGRLGIGHRWAELSQVHGAAVVRVHEPGIAGEADALWTTNPELPLAVFTADCFGVVLGGVDVVGVAHAGWRGAATGVVARLRAEMTDAGHAPTWAGIGPGIGPCCFEVGPEVVGLFTDVATTTWGTTSVDLQAAVAAQLDGLEVWTADVCTFHDGGWFSHRSSGTSSRLASIGWLS